ncbi:MAG TPA: aminopeptidase P N-terminal domain-containing protein, partial [Longimicrobiales bacterium]|nr:aminopeptidase P N-terminal domain-containing protein [Longimicrobiales bacterium]
MTERALPSPDYVARRTAIMDRLGGDAALIVPAAPEVVIGRDLDVRYRPAPDLLYLTGLHEPEAVAVFCPANVESPFTLFARQRDPERERWTGPRLGPEAAGELAGATAAHPIQALEEKLFDLVKDVDTIYFRLDCGRPEVERAV